MVPVIVRLVPTVAEVGLRLLIVGLGVEADATSPDTPQIETMISRARKILRTIGPTPLHPNLVAPLHIR
jgi:hypothetical protein